MSERNTDRRTPRVERRCASQTGKRTPLAHTVQAMLDSGLTVRDVADVLRADPRAIVALLAS